MNLIEKYDDVVYKNLGDDEGYGGNMYAPPGVLPKLEFGENFLAVTYVNDGHELWIDRNDEWILFIKDVEARKLAWFIIWTWWGKSTWFGLKSKLWYSSLSRIASRNKTLRP